MEAAPHPVDAQNLSEELYEKIKSYLMQADKDGASVYDYLQKIMLLILEENPNDLAGHPERFNEVLAVLKQFGFNYGEGSATTNEPVHVDHTQLTRHQENLRLFDMPQPTCTTTVEQPTPYTTITTTVIKPAKAPSFPALSAQNAAWRYGGYGLPDEEAFLVDQSITKLAAQKNLEEVRFVGKIFGTRANYLIVSSKRYVAENEKIYPERYEMPKAPRRRTEVPVQPEPGYKGVNRLSFWVVPHAAAEWVLLPDVTPQQINAARAIRKMFTGDLRAPVVSSPPFEWPESVYLRAQLSRIVAATYISPSGALERVEPEEEDEEEEEDLPPGKKPTRRETKYHPLTVPNRDYLPEEDGIEGLADLSRWVHSEEHIFQNGRMTRIPEKPEEEEEDEVLEETFPEDDEEAEGEPEPEEEPERELFAPISGDYLYAVVDIPAEPEIDEEDEEEYEREGDGDGVDEAAGAAGEEADEEAEEEPEKPLEDEDFPDDDPLKKKVTAWTARIMNATYKKHAVVAVRSLVWPGAIAYAQDGGAKWGCVYFGLGLKHTDSAFAPKPAPAVLGECKDLLEAVDPPAATEKLVLRGEELPEEDSEDEKEEEEEPEDTGM